MSKDLNKPTFTMLVGLPASGKSYYAKNHEDSNNIWISSDEIRKEMNFGAGEGTEIVFRTMHDRTKEALLEGKSVFYDATNLSRKRRMPVLDSLKNIPCIKNCILFMEPYEECLKTNSERKGFELVPDHIIESMVMAFQPPMLYEGFDNIEIKQRTKGISLDEYFEMAKGFNQENSHHDFSLYDHLMLTKEFISSHFSGSELDKEILEMAALCHDIGKLATKTFIDARGNESKDAHYYKHENVGSYMFLASDHGLSSDKALYVASLISWHMRPYLNMSDRKRNFEKELVGDKFWKDLELLHKADEVSHKDTRIKISSKEAKHQELSRADKEKNTKEISE